MAKITVPCTNLAADSAVIKAKLLQAVERVLDSGMYILDREVETFEREFAQYCEAECSVGVACGTSALMLLMQAYGIGKGDEVLTAPNSFVASASATHLIGATPTFADVGDDLNLDPEKVDAAITPKTKMIMVVHLNGRAARMDELMQIARSRGVMIIEDAAQSVGARYKGTRVGGFGNPATFSLHPLKNLHAIGDGGMITLPDSEKKAWLDQARNHGLRNRNECDYFSYNFRLDEVQAAMLRIQLEHLDHFTDLRRNKARFYQSALAGLVQLPLEAPHEEFVFQNFVIRVERRDQLAEFLLKRDIAVRIHYPIPIHLQAAAAQLGYKKGDFPMTERLAQEILTLPLFPSITQDQQQFVVESIQEFYAS